MTTKSMFGCLWQNSHRARSITNGCLLTRIGDSASIKRQTGVASYPLTCRRYGNSADGSSTPSGENKHEWQCTSSREPHETSNDFMMLEEQAALYVHWPYCERRCTYCNFNKYISSNVDHQRMRKCLVQETQTLLALSQVKQVTSVFFGGGTPSLAEAQTIESVLQAVRSSCTLGTNAEVTLEVNPNSAHSAKLRDFVAAGINRLSVGVQTICSDDLHVLGRDHSVEEALRCLAESRRLLPGRVSVDLIFGRPRQTLDQWTKELYKLLPVCDDHISLYQLTLERGTGLFKQVEQGQMSLPGSETLADMYKSAVQILSEHAYHRYEASNFARSMVAESAHNKTYWSGAQYIGVGPGSHGRFVPFGSGGLQRECRIQTLEPEPWMREVERNGHGTRRAVAQSKRDILEEILMLGLRTTQGVNCQAWSHYCQDNLHQIFDGNGRVQMLVEQGFLIFSDSELRATAVGLDVVDSLAAELLLVLQQYMDS